MKNENENILLRAVIGITQLDKYEMKCILYFIFDILLNKVAKYK